MSFCVVKDSKFQQNALKFLLSTGSNEEPTGLFETFGGILSNLNYAWLVNGSKFVVVSCKRGNQVGSWDFVNTLHDNTSKILGVGEIHRSHGREPLLAISINCETNGGIICIFDFIGSKVIRAIHVVDQISYLHVIDVGQDLFNLSGPLQNFDGIFAVGTLEEMFIL
ncbi:hypothetical protein HHI36_005369 [Cryptolaemus montrouzieri]|uniref:Uncharacterized protein n=1 Tax=Cryptolaemus montrouzieri TaxID=559131 RepID=A0ABD2NU70_9CUCU